MAAFEKGSEKLSETEEDPADDGQIADKQVDHPENMEAEIDVGSVEDY